MKIAVAADHAGYPLKQVIVSDLRAAGHDITDLGTHDPNQPDDYPDFARLACEAIRHGKAERAVVVCGSGVGVTVAAIAFDRHRFRPDSTIFLGTPYQAVAPEDLRLIREMAHRAPVLFIQQSRDPGGPELTRRLPERNRALRTLVDDRQAGGRQGRRVGAAGHLRPSSGGPR